MEAGSNKDWAVLDSIMENPQEHMQILKRARKPRRTVPAWAGSLASIEAYLLRPVKRRARVAYLYWVMNWTVKDIAEDLGDTKGAVRQLLKRMSRE